MEHSMNTGKSEKLSPIEKYLASPPDSCFAANTDDVQICLLFSTEKPLFTVINIESGEWVMELLRGIAVGLHLFNTFLWRTVDYL